MDGLRPKKPKTINLQRVGWKNWALVNQTTNKVSLNNKRVKINKCKLKKIVLGKVQGDCSYILFLNLITSLVPDCYSQGCPLVGPGWVYAQSATDPLTSGGRLNDLPPTTDDLGSSQIGLRWTMVRLVGLDTEVNHGIFVGLKLKTTTQAQISEKITRSKQKLKQKAQYQAQI